MDIKTSNTIAANEETVASTAASNKFSMTSTHAFYHNRPSNDTDIAP
jgi:hypothetical protein